MESSSTSSSMGSHGRGAYALRVTHASPKACSWLAVLLASCHDGAPSPSEARPVADASPPGRFGPVVDVDDAEGEGEGEVRASRTTPPAPVRGVVAGAKHACAWLVDDRVLCWGSDAGGAIGDGSEIAGRPEDRVRPFPVPMIGVPSGLRSFGPGFAIDARGDVLVWRSVLWLLDAGDSYYEHRTTAAPWSLPPKGIVDLALASNLGCVLTREGQVQCAGSHQTLGDGSTRSRAAFGPVPLPGRAKAIAAAGHRACAALDDGTVRCWGQNPVAPRDPAPLGCGGEPLAMPSAPPAVEPAPSEPPTPGPPPTQMVDPCASRMHIDPLPVTIAGVADVLDVELGDDGWGCAVVRGGGVQCWGKNDRGQLGDGTTVDRLDARPVIGLRGPVAQLAGTFGRVCARLGAGTVDCWGSGYRESARHPVPVPIIDDAIDLSLGDDACVVRGSDRNVWCWGWRNVAFGDDEGREVDVPSPLHWAAP